MGIYPRAFRLFTLAFGLTLCASAEDIVIDFFGNTPGGFISYAGRSAPLVGASIPIQQMVGYGTPQHDYLSQIAQNPVSKGGFLVENGFLNFQTGGFQTRESDGTSLFSGGGFLTITGTVRASDGSVIVQDGVLLTGGLLGATFDRVGSVKLTIVTGSDTKHPAIVSWFGLPSTTQFEFSGSITSKAQVDSLNRYPVLGANIINTVVPEPASIALFGSVLWFVCFRLHKKRQAATT